MNDLVIHTNAEDELLNLFKSVIYHGENNSALVIGPRGSGKSFMIKKVLDKVCAELNENSCSNDLILVHLSGCLQSDDKSALLEISKQLKLENVINDKIFGSFSDSFEFLLKSFRTGNKQSKPLIFIMDEFDLFTKNKSQLLLYTLLNTIQTSSSPMGLIGITCRIDVLDLLEKRIKSRFSHRQIYLFNDYDFNKYLEMTKYFILNSELSSKSKKSKHVSDYVNDLLNDNKILKLLTRQFEYDKSISTLKRLVLLPSIRLNYLEKDLIKMKDLSLIVDEFTKSFDLLNIDTKSSLLNGISILELTLVVVMLDLSQKYKDEPFNFDIVYNSYLRFLMNRNWNQQKYEKQVILKAYEHLIALNFILPANDHSTTNSKNSKSNKEHTLMYLALDKEEIDKCLEEYPNCPTELQFHAQV